MSIANSTQYHAMNGTYTVPVTIDKAGTQVLLNVTNQSPLPTLAQYGASISIGDVGSFMESFPRAIGLRELAGRGVTRDALLGAIKKALGKPALPLTANVLGYSKAEWGYHSETASMIVQQLASASFNEQLPRLLEEKIGASAFQSAQTQLLDVMPDICTRFDRIASANHHTTAFLNLATQIFEAGKKSAGK